MVDNSRLQIFIPVCDSNSQVLQTNECSLSSTTCEVHWWTTSFQVHQQAKYYTQEMMKSKRSGPEETKCKTVTPDAGHLMALAMALLNRQTSLPIIT